MVICPSCGRDNRSSRHFCGDCGVDLGSPWPPTAAVNGTVDHYCGACGGELGAPPVAQRAPAAEDPRRDSGPPAPASSREASESAEPSVTTSGQRREYQDELQRRIVNELLTDLEEGSGSSA